MLSFFREKQLLSIFNKGRLSFVVQLPSPVPFVCVPVDWACQASLSMGFFTQEYWSGLSFSSPGDLPNPVIESVSAVLAGGFFTFWTTWRPEVVFRIMVKELVTGNTLGLLVPMAWCLWEDSACGARNST